MAGSASSKNQITREDVRSFPAINEIYEENQRIRHRYRRAMETGRIHAAYKARQDYERLLARFAAIKMIVNGFCDCQDLRYEIGRQQYTLLKQKYGRNKAQYDQWAEQYLNNYQNSE